MAFWRKRVELPDVFYEELGNCIMFGPEGHAIGDKTSSEKLTSAEAIELLTIAEKGYVKLGEVLSQFPIKTKEILELSDVSFMLRRIAEQKESILRLSGLESSIPLSSYQGKIGDEESTRYVGEVFRTGAALDTAIEKAVKLIARSINLPSRELIELAIQKVRDTPRGKALAKSW